MLALVFCNEVNCNLNEWRNKMDPFVGEIRLFAFPFQPQGWLVCDGQLLSINQYNVLYSLLGTRFGGDGVNSFALPDLRGRVPVGFGQGSRLLNYTIGEKGGKDFVDLDIENIPNHSHNLIALSDEANTDVPTKNFLANSRSNTYASPQMTPPPVPDVKLHEGSMGLTGEGKSVYNMQPFLTMAYHISFEGVYPPRS
jgi:microcystin-dependent protein